MPTPLESLVQSGTKLWVDSVDPQALDANIPLGASGATSNPSIIANLIETGRFDDQIGTFMAEGHDDEAIAWAMTDHLVQDAQSKFTTHWSESKGNTGWVSFELDPLLEDAADTRSVAERAATYIELGKKWAAGHTNRMIKVPATEAGIAALEELAAAGITLNVTLIFSERQYLAARDAVWAGAQRRASLDGFKSVFSIFVSRVDVYTEQNVSELSDAAQGQVGLVNAKRLWQLNHDFWADKGLGLEQEIIFASTGTKKPEDPADKYVGALAGSDIQTNPPETNDKVQALGKVYRRTVDILPSDEILADIDAKVDNAAMEDTLMSEGTAKFAEPHKKLIELIGSKRGDLAGV